MICQNRMLYKYPEYLKKILAFCRVQDATHGTKLCKG
jgi:hypothetical protein